jgi:carboxymethylenebutenolidase
MPGLLLGHPAQGFCRSGPDPSAVPGSFHQCDDWCTPAAVDAFQRTLQAVAARAEIYRYDAAHAFANERGAA